MQFTEDSPAKLPSGPHNYNCATHTIDRHRPAASYVAIYRTRCGNWRRNSRIASPQSRPAFALPHLPNSAACQLFIRGIGHRRAIRRSGRLVFVFLSLLVAFRLILSFAPGANKPIYTALERHCAVSLDFLCPNLFCRQSALQGCETRAMPISGRDTSAYRADEKQNHQLLSEKQRQYIFKVRK